MPVLAGAGWYNGLGFLLGMVSFEIFVKSMPPTLSELKVTPNFCFPFKIPDDPTAINMHVCMHETNLKIGLNRLKSLGCNAPYPPL